MIPNRRLSSYGLKWNPFTPSIPTSAIQVDGALSRFLWQMDELALDGGFALVTGESGSGKSVSLRLLRENLEQTRDNVVVALTRPQSTIADFYRELGAAFGAEIRASNRWGGFRALREKWKAKLQSSPLRPVVLIDEAQDMNAAVLSEVRSLSSDELDSNHLLTVVLCGDDRLLAALESRELRSIASRIRVRLQRGSLDPSAARESLIHAMSEAGNPKLFTDQLVTKVVEHALGNWRSLMITSAELLQHALRKDDGSPVDEQLFLEVNGGSGKRVARRGKSPQRA